MTPRKLQLARVESNTLLVDVKRRNSQERVSGRIVASSSLFTFVDLRSEDLDVGALKF